MNGLAEVEEYNGAKDIIVDEIIITEDDISYLSNFSTNDNYQFTSAGLREVVIFASEGNTRLASTEESTNQPGVIAPVISSEDNCVPCKLGTETTEIGGLKKVLVTDFDGNNQVVIVGDCSNDPQNAVDEFSNEEAPAVSKTKSTKRKKGRFPCSYCDYVSSWKKCLRRHILTVHERRKPYNCPQCNYSASEKIILTRHIVNSHKGECAKPFKCLACSYSTVEKSKLERHTKSVHEGVHPHKCDLCPFSASSRSRLKRHVLSVHEGVKRFKCPQCDHTTSEKNNLKVHVLSVHMNYRPYKCNFCPYTSSEKCALNRHLTKVHKDWTDAHGER